MLHNIVSGVKRHLTALLIITGSLLLFRGDTAQFLLQLYALSAVALVLIVAHFILDDRENWGLFPYINLKELVVKAKTTSLGAAIIFAAVLFLLATIINVSVLRH